MELGSSNYLANALLGYAHKYDYLGHCFSQKSQNREEGEPKIIMGFHGVVRGARRWLGNSFMVGNLLTLHVYIFYG